MRKVSYRLITGALLLGWMLIIFEFSAQPATQSQQMSGSVSYRIIESCDEMLRLDMTEGEIKEWAERIDFPIRKGAHMAEYAVCAVLSACCVIGYWTWNRKTAMIAFCVTACYAMTDEIHQLFVPGRAGRISDVFIDSLGVAMGLLLFGIVLKIMDRHCEK